MRATMKTFEQLKSRDRVVKFGEVNTSEEEVNAMLDLVKQETERLDARFLEPACGDGNFLSGVLDRKLSLLGKRFNNNQYEFEKNSVVVIGSIYGLDILKDNVRAARKRLLKSYMSAYQKVPKEGINNDLIKTIRFILRKNIIHGNALTLKKIDTDKPIVFCEWALVNNKVKRRDFTFGDLLAYSGFGEGTLFSDMGKDVFIPSPVREHALIKFDRVFETC